MLRNMTSLEKLYNPPRLNKNRTNDNHKKNVRTLYNPPRLNKNTRKSFKENSNT